ncbi:MAG: hypothetical protein KAT79_04595 [candidate division Zixibacteria bacterium]|nr:hypothetical protein [candidate division Zixibacteria bacterium]
MKTFLPLVTVLIIALVSAASAETGVKYAIATYQHDAVAETNVLLLADTIVCQVGLPVSGFLTSFSAELEVIEADTAQATFNVHVITLGPNANTYSKAFTAEYGLPARIDGISGKNDSKYSLVLVPIESVEIDPAICEFDHRSSDDFRFLPTAHTDIHFVSNSLGDFYFDAVKEVMETQYRLVRAAFNFDLPGKYSVYLCPCPVKTVIWDKRFGMAIDPTRSTAFAIYSHELNSTDPFVLILTAILRNWGYAPPFLAEGMAGYQSTSVYDIKKIIAEGKAIPLADLIGTYDYYQADPFLADRTATSFVNFLINSYGLDMFSDLYQQADDLNLREKIETVYQVSLDSLESEWQNAIDLTEININDLGYQAYLAEMMFDYPSMLKYCQAASEFISTSQDSIRTLSQLKRAYFFNGDYYGATEVQQLLTPLQPSMAINLMAEGSYKMMNALYSEAIEDFNKALQLDSTHQMSRFNLAIAHINTGNDSTAISLFREVIASAGKEGAQGESRVLLGNLLLKSNDENDRKEAERVLSEAQSIFAGALQTNRASASSYMWIGVASCGLGQLEGAITYLETALFLESRPFYLGLINLWLGKAHDLNGDHTRAREYYGRTLGVPSAAYHQDEARRYLETPFSY